MYTNNLWLLFKKLLKIRISLSSCGFNALFKGLYFFPLNHFFVKFVLHSNNSLVKYRLLYTRQRFSMSLLDGEMFVLLSFFAKIFFGRQRTFLRQKGILNIEPYRSLGYYKEL